MSPCYQIKPSAQCLRLVGILPAARPLILADQLQRFAAPVSIVCCESGAALNELGATLPVFLNLADKASGSSQWEIHRLPQHGTEQDGDPLPERLREEYACDRMATLTALAQVKEGDTPAVANRRMVVLTVPDGLFAPATPIDALRQKEIVLNKGGQYAFETLRQRLAQEMDYDAEAICERPGQFAVRGGLIDVYPLNGNAPVRLDFFGDELESIRTFDPTTQRSLDPLDGVTIAARDIDFPTLQDKLGLLSYLGAAVNWYFVEPARLVASAPRAFEAPAKATQNADAAGMAAFHQSRRKFPDRWVALQELEMETGCFAPKCRQQAIAMRSLEPYTAFPADTGAVGSERKEIETHARQAFLRQLAQWQESANALITGFLPTQGKIEEVTQLLKDSQTPVPSPALLIGDLAAGFIVDNWPPELFNWLSGVPTAPWVIVSEREWLDRHAAGRAEPRNRLLPQRSRVDALLDFADLADGDYLVHLSHGICRYRGLQKMAVRGRPEEVISVEFADHVTLHVPLSEAHLLTRYVGLARITPRLGKLGSNNWDKTRAAAERATLDFAAEMLQIQAARDHGAGHAFGPDSEWQKAFENAFPFRETTDQLKAIEDTKRDMETAKAMDRLVCGDVGFGKTEVAIRAAFKAIMEGFQVAIMVPTTILAQQHYETFRQRFAAYPFKVEMLSRFRTTAQQKQILTELRHGTIDLVVGTHRLISKDVHFAKLGLLVIDEEHRFGVRHKDEIKRRRLEVDVLSMSATPIPRTLYLALMGARDLSVIETPPADRLPIETLVRSYDPDLIQKAIRRELDRGGQVFYLHNRVQSIAAVAARIQDMVPEANVEVGHGQMSEDQLERVMLRFVSGKTDILVCTTIIENGLDIPNCNTIFIEGADRFGLSQLYQLRGRVGRFKRQAYAYLLLHRHSAMLDQARKRLSAMRQHNQLGAGFRIAMRDLELRGAGNLLGHQQSGHIAGVGFDLYCQLLRQSIQRLKGDPNAARIRAHVNLDFIQSHRDPAAAAKHADFGLGAIIDAEIADSRIAPVTAELPVSYINETKLRIDFYRQLAMAENLATVSQIADAMADRFGKLPKPVMRLLALTRIRILAETAGLRSVASEGNRLKCQRASTKPNDFLQLSGRFPRLSSKNADLRLREIESFLSRQTPAPPKKTGAA